MNSYILEEHKAAIAEFAIANKVSISFREAGENTIERLKLGCPCKGHDVLEKSIKAKSLNAPNVDHTVLGSLRLQVSKLSGLIGHWSPMDNGFIFLEGVYLSNYGVSMYSRDPFLCTLRKCVDGNGIPYENIVKINAELCANLDIKNRKNYNRYFLTGDYDIHDMIDVSTNPAYSIFDPIKEKKLQEKLNTYLRDKVKISPRIDEPPYCTIDANTKEKKEIELKGDTENELNFIRHGAQVNYPAHMLNSEKGKKLVVSVVLPDLNLYAVSGKGGASDVNSHFTMIDSLEKLKCWYESNHAVMKHTYVEKVEDSPEVINLINRNKTMREIISFAIHALKEIIIKEESLAYPRDFDGKSEPQFQVMKEFYFQFTTSMPNIYENIKNRNVAMLEMLCEDRIQAVLENDIYSKSMEETSRVKDKELCVKALQVQRILYQTNYLAYCG